jgi:hypothetical protein
MLDEFFLLNHYRGSFFQKLMDTVLGQHLVGVLLVPQLLQTEELIEKRQLATVYSNSVARDDVEGHKERTHTEHTKEQSTIWK